MGWKDRAEVVSSWKERAVPVAVADAPSDAEWASLNTDLVGAVHAAKVKEQREAATPKPVLSSEPDGKALEERRATARAVFPNTPFLSMDTAGFERQRRLTEQQNAQVKANEAEFEKNRDKLPVYNAIDPNNPVESAIGGFVGGIARFASLGAQPDDGSLAGRVREWADAKTLNATGKAGWVGKALGSTAGSALAYLNAPAAAGVIGIAGMESAFDQYAQTGNVADALGSGVFEMASEGLGLHGLSKTAKTLVPKVGSRVMQTIASGGAASLAGAANEGLEEGYNQSAKTLWTALVTGGTPQQAWDEIKATVPQAVAAGAVGGLALEGPAAFAVEVHRAKVHALSEAVGIPTQGRSDEAIVRDLASVLETGSTVEELAGQTTSERPLTPQEPAESPEKTAETASVERPANVQQDPETGRGGSVVPSGETQEALTRPEPSQTPPAQATGATNQTEQVAQAGPVEFLDNVADKALKRIYARRKPGTLYSNPVHLIAADVLDATVYASAKVAKGGVLTAQAIRDAVQATMRDAGIDAKSEPRVVRWVTSVIRKSINPKTKTFEQERYGDAVARLARTIGKTPVGKKIKTQINEIAGISKTKRLTVTEHQALRSTLKSAERAAFTAYREGKKLGRAQGIDSEQSKPFKSTTLKQIKQATRPNALNPNVTSEAKALKARYRAEVVASRAAINQGVETRKKIVASAMSNLPVTVRGRLLTTIANAKTDSDVFRAVRQVIKWSAKTELAIENKKLRRASKWAKKKAKIASPYRQAVQQLAARGDALRDASRSAKTVDQLTTFASRIREVHEKISEQVALHKAEQRDIKIGKGIKLRMARSQLIYNVARRRVPRNEPGKDAPKQYVGRLFNANRDIDNLARKIEGIDKGVIRSLFNRIRLMQDKRTIHEQDIIAKTDAAARKAGFKSFGDAQIFLSGLLGDANVTKMQVTLGGNKMSVNIGQLLDLLASDAPTREAILDGNAIQFEQGKNVTPLTVSPNEWYLIEQRFPAQLLQFIRDLKAVRDELTPLAFKAKKRIDGVEPDRIDDQWPTRRNLKQSKDTGLPTGWKGTWAKFLENASFTKSRTGGNSPYIIEDITKVYQRQINAMLDLAYLAEPIRDAYSVVNNAEVANAIRSRFDADTHAKINDHLLLASGINEQSIDGFDRVLAKLHGNASNAYIAVNPGSWMRQMTGVLRLFGVVPDRVLVKGLLGAKRIGLGPEMEKNVPAVWRRYHHDDFARLSGLAAGGVRLADIDEMGALIRAGKNNLLAFKLGDAAGNLRKMMAVRRAFNFTDSAAGRVAYAGWKAEIERKYPHWDAEHKKRYLALKTTEAIRKSQNAADNTDVSSMMARFRQRQSLLKYFFVWSGDNNKVFNMLDGMRGKSSGKKLRILTGIALSMAISSAVNPLTHLILYGLGKGLGGYDDQEKRKKFNEKQAVNFFMKMGEDTLSTIYGGRILANSIRGATEVFTRGQAVDQPELEIVNQAFEGLSEVIYAFIKLNESPEATRKKQQAKVEKAWDSLWRGLGRIADQGSVALGDPTYIYRQYAEQVYKSATEEKPKGKSK